MEDRSLRGDFNEKGFYRSKASEDQLKNYLERGEEASYEDWFDNEMSFYDSPDLDQWTKVKPFQLKRQLRLKMPDNVKKWFKDSGNGNLLKPYEKYAKQQARLKNQLSKDIAADVGFSIEKEHWVPVSGADEDIAEGFDSKTGKRTLTPTRAISQRGADTEGGPGSGRWNRRIGSKRAFAAAALQQLNQPINWMESAVNFVADRPDLKSKLDGKVRGSDFLRLQQNLVSADEIEIEGFRAADLRRSGIRDPRNFTKIFKKLVTDIHNKDIIKSATDTTKKAWNVITKDRGDLSIADQERHDAAKLPRKTKTTYLPSQATGKTKVTKGRGLGGNPLKLVNTTGTKTKPNNTLSIKGRRGVGTLLLGDSNTYIDPVIPHPPWHFIGKGVPTNINY